MKNFPVQAIENSLRFVKRGEILYHVLRQAGPMHLNKRNGVLAYAWLEEIPSSAKIAGISFFEIAEPHFYLLELLLKTYHQSA